VRDAALDGVTKVGAIGAQVGEGLAGAAARVDALARRATGHGGPDRLGSSLSTSRPPGAAYDSPMPARRVPGGRRLSESGPGSVGSGPRSSLGSSAADPEAGLLPPAQPADAAALIDAAWRAAVAASAPATAPPPEQTLTLPAHLSSPRLGRSGSGRSATSETPFAATHRGRGARRHWSHHSHSAASLDAATAAAAAAAAEAGAMPLPPPPAAPERPVRALAARQRPGSVSASEFGAWASAPPAGPARLGFSLLLKKKKKRRAPPPARAAGADWGREPAGLPDALPSQPPSASPLRLPAAFDAEWEAASSSDEDEGRRLLEAAPPEAAAADDFDFGDGPASPALPPPPPHADDDTRSRDASGREV